MKNLITTIFRLSLLLMSTPRNAADLEKTPAFAVLRSAPEFHDLLAALKQPKE
jgi:hypothetical protein